MFSTVGHFSVSHIMNLWVKADVALAAILLLAKSAIRVMFTSFFHLSTQCPLDISLLPFWGHGSNGVSHSESSLALFFLVDLWLGFPNLHRAWNLPCPCPCWSPALCPWKDREMGYKNFLIKLNKAKQWPIQELGKCSIMTQWSNRSCCCCWNSSVSSPTVKKPSLYQMNLWIKGSKSESRITGKDGAGDLGCRSLGSCRKSE